MSIDFPKEEVATIERWREIKAFERQVSNKSISMERIGPLKISKYCTEADIYLSISDHIG